MIKHELRMHYKSTIIWSVAMAALIAASMIKGYSFIGEPDITAAFSSMPPILAAIFGISSIDISTPFGFYSVMYIYLAIALAIQGILAAVNTFSNEQTDHTFEYLLSKPVDRTKVYFSKILSSFILITIVNVITSACGIIAMARYYDSYPDLLKQMILLSVAIYLLVLLMVAISYIIMAFMRNIAHIATYSMIILLFFYLVNVFATMYPDNRILYYLTPMQFLGPIDIYNNELFIIGYVLVIVLFIISIFINLKSFVKREII